MVRGDTVDLRIYPEKGEQSNLFYSMPFDIVWKMGTTVGDEGQG
jgi:hypothetical protein